MCIKKKKCTILYKVVYVYMCTELTDLYDMHRFVYVYINSMYVKLWMCWYV